MSLISKEEVIQMVLSLLLGVVPLCVMVYAVGSADKGEQGVGQETMSEPFRLVSCA